MFDNNIRVYIGFRVRVFDNNNNNRVYIGFRVKGFRV